MTDQTVVTRFAPSPTGYLHIGGARTALFNWAYAKGHGGRFILRMEDTDQARSSDESTRRILEDLQWLGITPDEGPSIDGDSVTEQGEHGPYFQSRRLAIYNEHVDKLIDAGHAYKCFMPPEELAQAKAAAREAGRDYKYDRTEAISLTADQITEMEAAGKPCVVRFRMPDQDITIHDEVRGDVTISKDELEDFIIRKSDGFPTYHLAVVIDDALMGVNHVLRAQEHLKNTIKHVAIQDALGFERPKYAHFALIFNADGSKMSKRDKAKATRAAVKSHLKDAGIDQAEYASKLGISDDDFKAFLKKKSDEAHIWQAVAADLDVELPEIDVHDFRASGYLPQVVLNYIALLGWNPGDDIEKFDTAFLCERFDFDRVQKGNAKFDRDKLFRFNADAIAELSVEAFTDLFKAYCAEYDPIYVQKLDDHGFQMLAAAYHQRSRTLKEPCEKGRFFVIGDHEIQFDAKSVDKVLRKNVGEGLSVLRDLVEALTPCDDWTAESLETIIKGYLETKELGMGKVAQPLRVAVSGSTVSPPIYDTLVTLGKSAVLNRINRCLEING